MMKPMMQVMSIFPQLILIAALCYPSSHGYILNQVRRQASSVSFVSRLKLNNGMYHQILQQQRYDNNRRQSRVIIRKMSTKNVADLPMTNKPSNSDIVVTTNDNFQQTMSRSVTLDPSDQSLLTNIGSWILQQVLQSPLWKHVLVPMARQKIIDTAQENGIPWQECKNWLFSQSGPWNNYSNNNTQVDGSTLLLLEEQLQSIPAWYRTAAYHAYETGHLSWDAAIELELASAAIGARNIPKGGALGEVMFRSAFTKALYEAGAMRTLPPSHDVNYIIDIGCGTGTSTRLLAQMFPEYSDANITGIDLSPYFVHTGVRLRDLLSDAYINNGNHSGPWVCDIKRDDRIRYVHGDGTNLHSFYKSGTVDIVNVQFVFHELPVHVACDIIQESYRILKADGGQLWICEMDFESPAYKAQRSNPLLFSLVRSTEPFLDEYANGQNIIWNCLYDVFDTVTITAATGRHFAVVATKGGKSTERRKSWNDMRFLENGQYRVDDTHLQVWENKLTEDE